MKLPFDFGVKLIFRLIIPGALLALGLLPVLNVILAWGGWSSKVEYAFPLLAIFIGWLLLISDMHIYMLFEGRRYWPNFLLECFSRKEKKRLAAIKKNIDDHRALEKSSPDSITNDAYQKYLENYVEQYNFPMDDKGGFEAKRPSRLGNLISAYEDYPYRVYRMDAVFYWPRLWLKLTKEVREEVDNQQAVVDSAVYTSFALCCNGLLWLIYAVLSSLQALFIKYSEMRLPPSRVTVFEYLPDWWITWLLFLVFTTLGYCIYRVSVHSHTSFGDIFRSLFDNYQKDFDVLPVIKEVSELTGRTSFLNLSRKDQLEVTRDYLDYGLVKCPRCKELMPAGDMKNHKCS